MNITKWKTYQDRVLKKYLKEIILEEKRQGHKIFISQLAPKLGIKKSTLYYLINKYDLKKFLY